MRSKRYKIFLILSILLFNFITENDLSGQAISTQSDDQVEKLESNTRREELQRYFGYEKLLYRYLTLPYDVSINTNQSGNFLDIGFLFIIFIPIILLFLSREKITQFLFITFCCFFLFIIGISNSFVFSHQKAKVSSEVSSINNYLKEVPFQREPLDIIDGYITKVSLIVYKPFKALLNTVSGDKDHFTFPFLIVLFCLLLIWLINKSRRFNSSVKSHFIGLSIVYAFYWYLFGSGIIWYGYILFILFYFLIALGLEKLEAKTDNSSLLKKIYIVLGFFWILIASVDRVSNIQPNVSAKELGKGIVNSTFMEFGSGNMSKEQAIEKLYPGIGKTLTQINSESNSKILRIGTSMSYFIRNNIERIQEDNQLGTFYTLYKKYPNKKQLVKVLKRSKFKYIIVDLNTASIDLTPEKTLTKKYNLLWQFISNNDRLILLATDNQIITKVNGQDRVAFGVFGQTYMQGRYAIFQLN